MIGDLLHLVDRAERGALLPGEAQQLRDGLRLLDAARTALESAGVDGSSVLPAVPPRTPLKPPLAAL